MNSTSVRMQDDGVAVCRLDNPTRGNALSPELVQRIEVALREATARSDIHTLMLYGSGRHFCTGFDLGNLCEENDASLLTRFIRIELLLDSLWRAPLRTVAVAHGSALGAGADLFVACDQRLVTSGSTLRFPGAGFGLVLGTRRLGARVGTALALHWVTEGTQVDTEQAVATGLATQVLNAPSNPGNGDEVSFLTAALNTLAPVSVRRETFAMLRGTLNDAGADADLAALVRSAAAPGLRGRIEAYSARVAAARGGAKQPA